MTLHLQLLWNMVRKWKRWINNHRTATVSLTSFNSHDKFNRQVVLCLPFYSSGDCGPRSQKQWVADLQLESGSFGLESFNSPRQHGFHSRALFFYLFLSQFCLPLLICLSLLSMGLIILYVK